MARVIIDYLGRFCRDEAQYDGLVRREIAQRTEIPSALSVIFKLTSHISEAHCIKKNRLDETHIEGINVQHTEDFEGDPFISPF